MKGAQKQLNIERDSQTETIFELDHQKKRSKDYQVQIGQLQWEVSTMRSHLPIISKKNAILFKMNGLFSLILKILTVLLFFAIGDGCKYCPEGWLFLNSYCYFYPFSARFGLKTWQQAREFCQMYGGDLLVIDSKDKEVGKYHFSCRMKNVFQNYLVYIPFHRTQLWGFWWKTKTHQVQVINLSGLDWEAWRGLGSGWMEQSWLKGKTFMSNTFISRTFPYFFIEELTPCGKKNNMPVYLEKYLLVLNKLMIICF